MKYRGLGDTGITVSEVGFGAWGIGGMTAGETSYGKTDDELSRKALQRAFELGITFFDTSNVYGDGLSEALIGSAFDKQRDRVVIATKAGLRRFDQAPDFSPAQIRRLLDGSLSRLRSDYVDLLQLHNPPPDLFVRLPEVYETLENLRKTGAIRAFGVSMKSPSEAMLLLKNHFVASVQVNLNMLDVRAAESGLLDLAHARKIAVIARTPLSFGFLSGKVTRDTQFPEGDHRRRWSKAQLGRWIDGANAMHAAAGAPETQTHSQVALRFCLSFEAVSSVIPGILTPDEATENAGASDYGPLSITVRDRIIALNREGAYFVSA